MLCEECENATTLVKNRKKISRKKNLEKKNNSVNLKKLKTILYYLEGTYFPPSCSSTRHEYRLLWSMTVDG